MDADLQHPPSTLPRMLDAIEDGADIVLPSRYIGGGESEGLSFIRTLFSKGAKVAAGLFLPSMRRVSDPMSGFFMFRRGVIQDVELNPIGWKILMEVLVMGHYQQVAEVPYAFEKRNAGESKLSLKVTAEYFLHILSLAARGMRERRRYALLLSCLLAILVDVLVFAACGALLPSLPLYAVASLSVCVGGTAQCLAYRAMLRKDDAAGMAFLTTGRYAILYIIFLALKNLFVFLLGMTGIGGVWVNLWSAALTMLAYALFPHKRLFPQTGQDIMYTTRL